MSGRARVGECGVLAGRFEFDVGFVLSGVAQREVARRRSQGCRLVAATASPFNQPRCPRNSASICAPGRLAGFTPGTLPPGPAGPAPTHDTCPAERPGRHHGHSGLAPLAPGTGRIHLWPGWLNRPAEPPVKAAIYEQLGLRVTYLPEQDKILCDPWCAAGATCPADTEQAGRRLYRLMSLFSQLM